jgi:ribonuclease HII
MVGPRVPSFVEENRLHRQGYRLVAGVDEVGRGALAGPVMAAAVILPPRVPSRWRARVRDSKLLSAAQRAALFEPICDAAVAVGVGSVDAWTIETIGIARATQVAMLQAIAQLAPAAETLLIDYFRIPGTKLPQKGVVDGDTLCFSIACASIVAKVTRDRLMDSYDVSFPGYLFSRHKGYGTPGHLACLRSLGPSPIHRRTFQPVAEAMGQVGAGGDHERQRSGR